MTELHILSLPHQMTSGDSAYGHVQIHSGPQNSASFPFWLYPFLPSLCSIFLGHILDHLTSRGGHLSTLHFLPEII